jgi:quinol monooxygenase YgiN
METKSILVKIRPEKRKEFLLALSSLQNESEKRRNRKLFKMSQDPEDQNLFTLIQKWETRQEMERYFESENCKVFWGALKTLCAKAEWK